MKKSVKSLVSLAIIFLIIMVMWETNTVKKKPALFNIEVIANGETETISYWTNANGEVIVFLPTYAKMADARIRLSTDAVVTLDGISVMDAMSCDAFQQNKPYELKCENREGLYSTDLIFVQSDKVATMFIDTQAGKIDYIHAQKENKEAGKMRLYLLDGSLSYIGDVRAFKGRGNSTWSNYEKKPYSLELVQEADLLGLGMAKKWVLLANAADPSHMRNKMVFDFAAQVGLEYSPASSWVDLYLNGEYAGLYLLCERNEIHPERVDIDSEDGALVSLELEERMKSQGNTYIVTDNNQALRIHSFTNEEEMILQRFQAIENALLAQDGMDSVSGQKWNELIDVDSWARKYLIEEIFANYDACYISQFFYFDAQTDGKVYAGPVWDYDLSMGSTLYWPYSTPQEYYGYRLKVQEGIQRPWFYQLYQKDEFRQRVEELFRDEFLLKVESMLSNGLNDSAIMLEQSAKMNQIRWSVDDSINDGIDQIREYMEERLDFLRKAWVEKKEYRILQANPGIAHYVYYAVQPGQCFTGLPELNNTAGQLFCGWYYENTDEPFDSSRPIDEDTAVYAKWEDTPHKQLEKLNKILPAGIIAIMFMVILAVEMRRIRKGG